MISLKDAGAGRIAPEPVGFDDAVSLCSQEQTLVDLDYSGLLRPLSKETNVVLWLDLEDLSNPKPSI